MGNWEKYIQDLEVLGKGEYELYHDRGVTCMVTRHPDLCIVNGYMCLLFGGDIDIYHDVIDSEITFNGFLQDLGINNIENDKLYTAERFVGIDTGHVDDYNPDSAELSYERREQPYATYKSVDYVKDQLYNMVTKLIETYPEKYKHYIEILTSNISQLHRGENVGLVGQSPELITSIARDMGFNMHDFCGDAIDLLDYAESKGWTVKRWNDVYSPKPPVGALFVTEEEYHPYGHCGVVTGYRTFGEDGIEVLRTVEQNVNTRPTDDYIRFLDKASYQESVSERPRNSIYGKIIGWFTFVPADITEQKEGDK